MAFFTPGQFRQKLQEKIKAGEVETAEEPPLVVKKTDPGSFTPRASDYHRAKSEPRIANSGTATLPKASPLNKSVHERMMSFVKEQYKK